MCGISGIITRSLAENQVLARLERMGQLQRHRGPDDRREQVFDGPEDRRIGLGLARLSILDLETGMQPIVCPEDGAAIVCNGQVYNYLELRRELAGQSFVSKGDIETALHTYRKKGLDFVNDLNGMYGGAIYDPVNHRVVLFRDRFGIKPLYYTTHKGTFVFASEIKPLLAGSGRPARLNEARLATFFTYRYVPGEQTLFEGVLRLPPASFLIYDLRTGKHEIHRYWNYQPDRPEPAMTPEAAQETFYDLFSDAVRIRLRSDVEVGALVSGGIDSSAVASQAVALRGPARLFTIAFEEQAYNELADVNAFLAANSGRFAGCDHIVQSCDRLMLERLPGIVESLEEPVSLGTVLPTDQVCELAGSHLKVVVTGEGADEIFAGYRKFLVEAAAHAYPTLLPADQKELAATYPELLPYLAVRHGDPAKRYIQSELLFDAPFLEQLLGRGGLDTAFPADALPTVDPAGHPVNTAIAFECRARLPDYVILRLDKLSMRHSLETRTPFLDYRLAEFAARLPVHLKLDTFAGMEKVVCRQAFERFGVLDRQTAFRKKKPFTIPLAPWLSEPDRLPEPIQEVVRGDMVARQGIVDPAIFKRLVENITSDNIGPHTLVSEADRVFAVIVFTLWYDRFMEK
ncbi:asparagine synthase (glutamine-hydrolyzing) [Desulfosudis oleivorans]|uniref:asparagine synthase (glutamine-hydrolyzing) n=1 Tax=Desulfosudis oleivorans (strain DSM 6200 / JCM 39069 / Hxd3) TaxID=96561 RepID=A8ZZB3_DESOH|nr:asparagine synthase (glutamine-hydrolyzing) [Desulfosudis oleivorans]ABW67266.1 asparagine synthase (glutamine-hydrolyzing) [Desulfosudis oleivorans Hxd3]